MTNLSVYVFTVPDEIGLVSARIVDSRIVNRTGKKFIQYKLEIRTNNYGTVYCWKRYSTFRYVVADLKLLNVLNGVLTLLHLLLFLQFAV